MIGYWISIVNNENLNKFSRKIYDIMLAEFNRGQIFNWLNCIKEILISVGEPGLFNQNFIKTQRQQKTKPSIG